MCDQLKIERYKYILGRLNYLPDLAKETFQSYLKIFIALSVAAVAILTAKVQLEISPEKLGLALQIIKYFITLCGVIFATQIGFCLARWYSCKSEEESLRPASEKPPKWVWIFEVAYIIFILTSVILTWWGMPEIAELFQTTDTEQGSGDNG